MENQIHIAFWKEMGADATPMSWGEAYTALQQGALDGQENPSTVILTNNVAQVNNHLAVTQHAYSTVFLIMSPATWASLGEEYQEIFKEVMAECSISERELSREMDSQAIDQLIDQGMTVTYPDKQEFVDAAADLYSAWEEQFGDIISEIRALSATA
jgi:TRAP-type C4-dicarboxylate transport system substrate-binding protein